MANGNGMQMEDAPAFVQVMVSAREKRLLRHLVIECDSNMRRLGGAAVRARLTEEPELEQMVALFDAIRDRERERMVAAAERTEFEKQKKQ